VVLLLVDVVDFDGSFPVDAVGEATAGV